MRKFPGFGLIIGFGLFLFACANDYNLNKLEREAEKGDVKAQMALGYSADEKREIEVKNKQKMLSLFMPAAKLGDVNAQTNLGVLYTGIGGKDDYERAYYWFRQAALRQESHAIYGLGFLYHQGLGVKQDFARARNLYIMAARLGEMDAVYNLGNMYARGEGVAQDYIKARDLWRQAAKSGGPDAMFNLGQMYVSGVAVNQSYSQAKELFKKACDLGQSEACQALKRL